MDNQQQFTQSQKKEKPKRIKERFVGEAMELVSRWRQLYETKYQNDQGKIVKITLDQAAEVIGVPRKTLEDYYYQLKRVQQMVNLENMKLEKMGAIRKLVKQSKMQSTRVESKKMQTDDKIEVKQEQVIVQQNFDTNQYIISDDQQRGRSNSFEFALQDKQTDNIYFNQDDFLNMNYLMNNQTFLQGQEWRMKFLQQQQIDQQNEMKIEYEE